MVTAELKTAVTVLHYIQDCRKSACRKPPRLGVRFFVYLPIGYNRCREDVAELNI